MVRKTALFAYGIKIIAIWMLIPFVLMFIPIFAGEFGAKVTVQEVTLVKETFSMYPDEHKRYEADVNGRKTNVIAPLTSKEGDTITVILRDGEYYKTANDAEDINANVSFAGRFMKIANNNFGYHVIGLAAAFLLTFLLTIKRGKAIRKTAPKLSKITAAIGFAVSVLMSAALLYGVIDNSLTSLGIAYLGLSLGILYTAVFVIVWAVRSAIAGPAKKDRHEQEA